MGNCSTFGSAPPGKANASRRLEEGLGMARTSDVTKIAKCAPDPTPSPQLVSGHWGDAAPVEKEPLLLTNQQAALQTGNA